MNSTKNISKNEDHTREVINMLWDNATLLQKQQVVEVGGFKDTKAVYYTRCRGRISTRMAQAFSQVFNVSFDYIIGKENSQDFIDTLNLDETSLPSDEESLKQYELLLNLAHFTKDESKKELINKIKVAIQKLL